MGHQFDLTLAGYILHGLERRESIGLPTELAALAVFLLGALSASGHPDVAGPLGIIVSAVLAFKEPLHALVEKIGREDIYAGLKLLIATFIVLPVLPDRAVDPWGASILTSSGGSSFSSPAFHWSATWPRAGWVTNGG